MPRRSARRTVLPSSVFSSKSGAGCPTSATFDLARLRRALVGVVAAVDGENVTTPTIATTTTAITTSTAASGAADQRDWMMVSMAMAANRRARYVFDIVKKRIARSGV